VVQHAAIFLVTIATGLQCKNWRLTDFSA